MTGASSGDRPNPHPAAGRRQIIVWALGVALVIALVLLRSEGHRWWCRLGDWSPWSTGIRSPHTSQHFVDPYSLTHVLHGLLLYALLRWPARGWPRDLRFLGAIVLECIWEVVENSPPVIERYRVGTIALGYNGDSVANSLGDIASCALGFGLAGRLPVRWSVVLFLGVDFGLLLAYRDNLLLNVIMLIHSFDAIKTWQAGP